MVKVSLHSGNDMKGENQNPKGISSQAGVCFENL